jgi:integrase/recombinase XerD
MEITAFPTLPVPVSTPGVIVPARLEDPPPPAIVARAGGRFAWDEFFFGEIRNPHTRKNYRHAVERFLVWCEARDMELATITPGMVGNYMDSLPLAAPTKKLHLAAIRGFFDRLVNRHVCLINPAATVKGERHQVVEGKTPEMTVAEATALLRAIPPVGMVALRDRAILATLTYTAARVGAVAKLRRGSLQPEGRGWVLRFEEKGGKRREIPLRSDLEECLFDYLAAAQIEDAPKETPLFRTAVRKTGQLTTQGMSAIDICAMLKRRLKDAGLPARLSPHSFRVMTITDLLSQGQPLEDVQYLAGHSDPRTTRLYDRRQKKVTKNLVERISVSLEPKTRSDAGSAGADRGTVGG